MKMNFRNQVDFKKFKAILWYVFQKRALLSKSFFSIPVIFYLTGCSTPQNNDQKTDEKAIAITTSEVKSEHCEVNLQYSGTVEPSQTIPLSFQTTGTVEKVLVNTGDDVKKGQLLATLDKSSSQNMYDIAKAKYQQAKDAYDRLKTVHEQGSLPEIKWVEMETNLEQAKSSLEMSENNLDKCNMYAPADGTVGHRNIEPGMSSLSLTSSPIELVEINTVFVKISVPENEIGKMKKGIEANIKVPALNDMMFKGSITNISPVADVFSHTYEVKITVNNSQLNLKPGMVCDVTLNLKSEKELVLIPYQSVTQDNDFNAFVYVVNKDRAKKQVIKTGNYRNNSIEVLSGITPGQVIVVEGKEKLSDNSLISL